MIASWVKANHVKNDARMRLWKRVTQALQATSSIARLCCSMRRHPSNDADSTTSSIPRMRLWSSPRILFFTTFLWLRLSEAAMLEVPALDSS